MRRLLPSGAWAEPPAGGFTTVSQRLAMISGIWFYAKANHAKFYLPWSGIWALTRFIGTAATSLMPSRVTRNLRHQCKSSASRLRASTAISCTNHGKSRPAPAVPSAFIHLAGGGASPSRWRPHSLRRGLSLKCRTLMATAWTIGSSGLHDQTGPLVGTNFGSLAKLVRSLALMHS